MNATIVITFLLFTGIAGLISRYRFRKNDVSTVNGLFLANRKLGPLLVGCALLFANINTASIVGENDLVYTNNMSVMAWGITSVIAMLIVSEFVMPVYLSTGIATTPDYLEMRYDRGTKRIVSFIFLVSYLVNLLPVVLYGAAVVFNGLFRLSDLPGMHYWTAIWILVFLIGGAGYLYTAFGGLRAIAVSDALLGVGVFAGGLAVLYFGMKYVGNGDAAHGVQVVLKSHTSHLNSIGSRTDAIPFSTLFTGMLLVNLYYWGTEQYIVQQLLASKDLQACQKGIAVAGFGKIFSILLLNIPGLIAVHLFSDLKYTAEVFPKMVMFVSPSFVTGCMAAAVFGAGISTFNAGLNSASTLFVLNIYKPRLIGKGKSATDATLVKAAKKFELAACVAAILIAPFILYAKAGFYTYVQTVNGFFNVPIFTIMLIGFVTKRVPPIAAKIGLFFFILCYGLTQLVFRVPIHFLHVLAILFILTSLLMLLIGKFFPLKTPYRNIHHNHVNMKPWRRRHICAVILIVLVIIVFYIFSPACLATGN